MLRTMGQLKGQGYLYGHPEDSASTRARLQKLNMLAGEAAAVEEETGLQRRTG
jgi:hypothetical protein